MAAYVSDKPNNFRTELGFSLFKGKYALTSEEAWLQRAQTIVDDVCGTRKGTTHPLMSKEERRDLVELIHKFVFLPGGRYIYYAGRGVSFFNNCFLFAAEDDSREEWGRILHSASDALMSGGGIGIDYTVLREKGALLGRTGGVASGPLPLAISVNEHGRNVKQGGSRRSAIYGSLNWKHPDAGEWLLAKDWQNITIPGTNVTYAEAKKNNFDAQAPLDFTNISLNYDNEFIKEVMIAGGVGDPKNPDVYLPIHDFQAWSDLVDRVELPETFVKNTEMALRNGEPGFSFNFWHREKETLRNACVSGDTLVLTDRGQLPISELVGKPVNIWNGFSWAPVKPYETGVQELVRIELTDGSHLDCTWNHKWVLKDRKAQVETSDLKIGDPLKKFDMPVVMTSSDLEFDEFYSNQTAESAYSQGFYAGDGNTGLSHSWLYSTKYCCEDRLIGSVVMDGDGTRDRKVWHHGPMIDKSFVPINGTLSYRLNWLSGLLDSDGTVTFDKNGSGFQIASINHQFLLDTRSMLATLGVKAKVVGGLSKGYRSMPDGRGGVKDYLCQESRRLLIGNTDAYKLMELGLDLSRLNHDGKPPQRDARRFIRVKAITPLDQEEMTYCFTEPMTSQGTFNSVVTGQCTEVVSEDDSDMCNIGSVNMAACADYATFSRAVELGSKFLICGTIRGALPDEKTRKVREKNRRIGLGLMGIHEWLLQRGQRYEVTEELHRWLAEYRDGSESAANEHCDRFYLSRPVAYRAVAPTGTIGTIAGTTTGIEPIYAVAYKRRYIEGSRETGAEKRMFQYYVDSAAKDMIDRYGVDPDSVESAIDLAKDPVRRIKFQADIQKYVDMGISSTLNLPEWGSEYNNEDRIDEMARAIAKYGPFLRGLTSYPDGSRGGQPLVSVPYDEAMSGGVGVAYEENSDNACKSGVCGI